MSGDLVDRLRVMRRMGYPALYIDALLTDTGDPILLAAARAYGETQQAQQAHRSADPIEALVNAIDHMLSHHGGTWRNTMHETLVAITPYLSTLMRDYYLPSDTAPRYHRIRLGMSLNRAAARLADNGIAYRFKRTGYGAPQLVTLHRLT